MANQLQVDELSAAKDGPTGSAETNRATGQTAPWKAESGHASRGM